MQCVDCGSHKIDLNIDDLIKNITQYEVESKDIQESVVPLSTVLACIDEWRY